MRVEPEERGEEIYDPRSRGRTFLALLFRAGTFSLCHEHPENYETIAARQIAVPVR